MPLQVSMTSHTHNQGKKLICDTALTLTIAVLHARSLQESIGATADDAVDFLSEKLFPLVDAYGSLRLALTQQTAARNEADSQRSKDLGAEISYRDFLLNSMVQATTQRLAQSFSKSYRGNRLGSSE